MVGPTSEFQDCGPRFKGWFVLARVFVCQRLLKWHVNLSLPVGRFEGGDLVNRGMHLVALEICVDVAISVAMLATWRLVVGMH
jgi:hypothetical protein